MNQTLSSGRSLATPKLALESLCASLLVLACGGGIQGGSDAAGAAPPTAGAPESTPIAAPAASAPATALARDAAAAAHPGNAPAGAPPAAAAAAPPPAASACQLAISFDDLYSRIQTDLSRQDARDRVFLRYVSLANRVSGGSCPADLESDRLALIKAVNSVSTETRIALPEAIDADRTLYRIDLRELGWDQPVVVDGVAFADKWEAIIADSAFAVEFAGDQADDAKLQANTRVPVLNSDALIDAALAGNLYYALLDVGETEDDLLAQLGIDEAAQEAQKLVIRAGTSQSRLSRQAAVAERLELENRIGYYWARYDIADSTSNQSIFADPLGFAEDSSEAIFSLPNGLNGYVIFDAAGVRQAETDVVRDTSQVDGLVHNSVSCSGCHAAGLNAITDEVRAYAQANSRTFDADTFSEILDSFPVQTELDATLRQDSALYGSALQRAGLDGLSVDPVNAVYVRFDGDVPLSVAAGDLGLTADELSGELGLLSKTVDPRLSVLRSASLTRGDFEGLYLATLCAVNISSKNRPAAAACAAVGQ